MKKQILKCFVVSLLFILGLQMQSQDRLFVYRNTGEVNAFLFSEIESLECSKSDTLGVLHEDYISQEIKTKDKVHVIPLAEIDSISFHAPGIVYKAGVEKLDNIRNYIISVSSDCIILSPSTPTHLIPSVGTKIATITLDDLFPYGYAGEVLAIEEREDGCIALKCTSVGLEDIFYSYYYSFDGSTRAAKSKAPSEDVVNDGSFSQSFNTISASVEVKLSNEVLFKNFPLEISGNIKLGVEWPTLSIKGYDLIVPDRGQVRHVTMEGDLTTTEEFSISVSNTNNHKDFPFPIIGHCEIPTGVPFLVYYYEFGGYYDLECSLTAGIEFKQDWKFSYWYESSNKKNPEFSIKQVGSTTSEGPICLKGRIGAGVYGELGVKPPIIDKDALGKIAGRFEVGVELNGKGYDVNDLLTAGTSTSLYDELIKDPWVKLNFYESLQAKLKILPLEETIEIFRGEIGTGITLGAQVPSFYNLLCNRVGDSDHVRVTSEIANNCFLPFKVGFSLFDNSHKKITTTYHDDSYYKRNFSSFGVELENAQKNNKYKAYPIIKILGYEILCNPSVDVKGNFDVITIGTASVGNTSATILGYVEGEHSEHGLQYFVSPNWITIKSSDNNEGNYSASLTGLQERTEYFFRAYIVVDGKTYYGDQLSFRTSQKEDPVYYPKAFTGNYSSVTSTTATIECSYSNIPVEAVCGYNLHEVTSSFNQGFSENPIGRLEGSTTINLKDLKPSTQYCYSAYVYFNGRYYDGEDKYFTTKTPQTKVRISNVTSTSASINCEYTDVPNNSKLGFYLWSEDMDFGFIERDKYEIQGLEMDKEYFVKGVVIYNDREYPSEITSFKTNKPVAITGKYTDLTASTVTCYASFENVPENSECFICLRYSSDDDYYYQQVEPKKNVKSSWTNLQAGHKYYYKALIVFDGQEFPGEELTFTIKEIPIELYDFNVTKAEWKRNGFEVNGNNYSFKYNFSLTARLKDSSNVEDWGYVYVDPEGKTAHISLIGKATTFVDDRYAYCRNEAQSSVILYGYVKYYGSEVPVYDEGYEVPLIYDEEPSISFVNAEIVEIESVPQYNGDGTYLFTWYTTKFKYTIQITGGYWIDNIQPIVYENGSWSYNGGKARVPGDGLYSVSSSMSYDNDADMNWATGYCITLADGSITYTLNEIQFGGTPQSPTVSVSNISAKASKKRAKVTNKTPKSLGENIPKFGDIDFE